MITFSFIIVSTLSQVCFNSIHMKHSTTRHRRFSIGVVAYRDLAELARGVIAAYAREADFHVIDKPFEEGLEAAAALDQEHRLDAVVSAGASGQALRQRLRCPVSLINVTGYDVLNAVVRARQISTRAAVFTFAGMNINLEQTKSLLNLDLIQVPYLRLADIATRLRELYSEGVRVAIGSSVVKEEAARLGMHGIFIHSAHSVTLAVE